MIPNRRTSAGSPLWTQAGKSLNIGPALGAGPVFVCGETFDGYRFLPFLPCFRASNSSYSRTFSSAFVTSRSSLCHPRTHLPTGVFEVSLVSLCCLETQGGLSLGHRVCLALDDIPGDQGSRARRSLRPWRESSTGESRVGGLGGQDTPRRCPHFTVLRSVTLSCAHTGTCSASDSVINPQRIESQHGAAVYLAIARVCLDVTPR